MNSPQLWLIANKARLRAKAVERLNPKADLVDAITALILSAAAAQGFINELASTCFDYRGEGDFPANLSAFAKAGLELEKNRATTLSKYDHAWEAISGVKPKRGQNPHQNLQLLMQV